MSAILIQEAKKMGFNLRFDKTWSEWVMTPVHPAIDAPDEIRLNGQIIELIDRMYCAGHRHGWERAAYELETKEDVEPSYEDIKSEEI